MNKKQIVRLTESDLHRIVKESVNKVLTELDWKTYANASKVAKEKGKKWNDEFGENGRSKRFEKAAREQFAKDKGYSMGNPSYKDNEYFEPDSEYSDFYIPYDGKFEPHYGQLFTSDGSDGEYDYESDMHVRIPDRFIDTKPYDGLGIASLEYNPDDEIHKKLNDDWHEINDFKRGKYGYQKGKGWAKNESISRKINRIVKESVNRLLKEEYKDPFNFFPDEDFSKEPTHRINLFYVNGGDVSSPAIFSSDEEAIDAAIKEARSQGGICGIKVEKYSGVYDDNGFTSLKTIFEKGKTY